MQQIRIELIDLGTDGALSSTLSALLETEARFQLEHRVVTASELAELRTPLSVELAAARADAILLCCSTHWLPHVCQLLDTVDALKRSPTTVVVAEPCHPEQLINLLNAGATEFLLPPFDAAHVMPRLWRWLKRCDPQEAMIDAPNDGLGVRGLVGGSAALLAEIKKLPAIAACDATALIVGETGTGKELCARAIHDASSRSKRPFIPVNCGAIPCELVENELFGHEPGAFTHAKALSAGLVQEAEGGTLFLDEVDSLPLLAQVKLLRFLQEKEYRRLGSRKTCKANVRVLAATNCKIGQAIRAGLFREDLYYRLSILMVTLPPLRERIGDISLLALHFVRKCAVEFRKPVVTLAPGAIQRLIMYDWPGNVRELENVITRSVLLAQRSLLQAADLAMAEDSAPSTGLSFREAKAVFLSQFERRFITEILIACGGNISRAAQAADKNRRAFFELMRKHHIQAGDPKPSVLLPYRFSALLAKGSCS